MGGRSLSAYSFGGSTRSLKDVGITGPGGQDFSVTAPNLSFDATGGNTQLTMCCCGQAVPCPHTQPTGTP